jgi:hypothetical protein
LTDHAWCEQGRIKRYVWSQNSEKKI